MTATSRNRLPAVPSSSFLGLPPGCISHGERVVPSPAASVAAIASRLPRSARSPLRPLGRLASRRYAAVEVWYSGGAGRAVMAFTMICVPGLQYVCGGARA